MRPKNIPKYRRRYCVPGISEFPEGPRRRGASRTVRSHGGPWERGATLSPPLSSLPSPLSPVLRLRRLHPDELLLDVGGQLVGLDVIGDGLADDLDLLQVGLAQSRVGAVVQVADL